MELIRKLIKNMDIKRTWFVHCAIISSFLFLSFSLKAADAISQAKKATRLGQYNKAFEIFLSAAQKGNIPAQYHVGTLYLTGRGIKKDISAGVKWIQHAANDGYPRAQYYLGTLYNSGEHVKVNVKLGQKWLGKAANQD